MDERYLSRKFILAAFYVVSSVPLLVYGHLPVESFVTLAITVLGLYFTGNVAQSAVGTTAK